MSTTRVQRERISQFRSITGAGDKLAQECLKQTSWQLEQAIDHYYTSGLSAQVTGVDIRAIEAIFKKYQDKDGDSITAEGVMSFCEDLKVEPEDVVMLVIACYMNAAHMGEFTKEEFTAGMLKLGCDSIVKLQAKLPDLRAELKSPDRYKDIYNYAYQFCREKGQKCVHLETALGMWQLLFPAERPWPLLAEWSEFLSKQHAGKAISKDTWTQLLDFIKTIKPDLSNFDPETSAWPYLIDEFVEMLQAKKSS